MVAIRLNLGCGAFPKDGYINVDKVALPGVDQVIDLLRIPWPFDDESVDEVLCEQLFEHFTGQERITFMNELWRVMKIGARARIVCPYYTSHGAIADPTHQWPPVSEASFLYFNWHWRKQHGLAHYPLCCHFEGEFEYVLDDFLASRNDETREFAKRHYLNSVSWLIVTLTRGPVLKWASDHLD